MSSKIDDLLRALHQVQYREDVTVERTPPSPVSYDNPYRPYLDAIRDCLIHYSPDNKVRATFTIEALKAEQVISPELDAVLDRVIVVLNEYNKSGKVLCSPEKKGSPASRVSSAPHGESSPRCARKLFADLQKFSEPNE
ncbi:MAG: hypothetical protein KDK64_02405 [Chlamydiia bacterium]|nr:hypothetical protein [Chlamydiia bacterium]